MQNSLARRALSREVEPAPRPPQGSSLTGYFDGVPLVLFVVDLVLFLCDFFALVVVLLDVVWPALLAAGLAGA